MEPELAAWKAEALRHFEQACDDLDRLRALARLFGPALTWRMIQDLANGADLFAVAATVGHPRILHGRPPAHPELN